MKVKEVLTKIGDGPLVQALAERGYFVQKKEPKETYGFELAVELESLGYLVVGEGEDDKLLTEAGERGFFVLENVGADWIADAYEMYRNRNADGFRNWLRDFFYETLGRIA